MGIDSMWRAFPLFLLILIGCSEGGSDWVDNEAEMRGMTAEVRSLTDEKPFPKEKFYDFKIGDTRENAIKTFGKPFSEDAPKGNQNGNVRYITCTKWMSRHFQWTLDYDSTGTITAKAVYEIE